MSRIEQLTPDQEQRLESWRDEWLAAGLATGPADRERAVRGVASAYRAAGLEPPRLVVWLRSPLEGAIGAAMLAQVGDQVWAQVRAQVRDQVRDQVWDQVRAQVRDQVWDQVRDQVGDQVWAQVRAQVSRCGYGQHDASWLSFYKFFLYCGLDAPNRLDGLSDLAMSCGWWWPFANAVILTERPEQLHRDNENRLHHESGAAILYPDGWGVWAWHGVRVPQRVIEAPESLTVAEALAEQNVEVRRVMLLRIGAERIEAEGGMVIVDEVTDDQVEVGTGGDGLPTPVGLLGGRLYRLPSKDDMPAMQWVALANSTPESDGSVKRYFLRVPPNVETVREGVAWTFDVPAHEYQPEAET